MSEYTRQQAQPQEATPTTTWVIVVADDAEAERSGGSAFGRPECAVQYERLGGTPTLLQKALRRAVRIAPATRVFVTVRSEDRQHWQPLLWFVKPEHRLVANGNCSSGLAAAAGFLRIAAASASDIVVVMPARCFVANEEALHTSICRAVHMLPSVREGALTLGMRDLESGPDEDYLLPVRDAEGTNVQLLGVARRPVSWVAKRLTRGGAMVASGILVGYSGVFASHISRFWPGLATALIRPTEADAASGEEVAIQSPQGRTVPSAVVRALRWQPPFLPQCALRVDFCGWSGLRSARSIARVRDAVAVGNCAG